MQIYMQSYWLQNDQHPYVSWQADNKIPCEHRIYVILYISYMVP